MRQLSALEKFLSKNTISGSADMPAFHTTSAYSAKRIMQDGQIVPRKCDIFKGEELTYLFYGRPSYKKNISSQIAKYWQLPSVFIFEHDLANVEHIFPFDTGAFESSLFPDYISMISRNEYQLPGNLDLPQRMVSSFFVDTERYFRLRPRDRSDFINLFEVGIANEEITALYDLINDHSEKIDDRRFAIEMQIKEKIEISKGSCKALIVPEEYLEVEELLEMAESKDIEVLSYPSFPLKQEMYYFTIYNVIYELYKQWGFAR